MFKTNSKLRKIRKIVTYPDGSFAMGVVIPQNLKHWLGISVTVRESGNSIVLESGGMPNSLNDAQLKKMSIKIKNVYI